MMLSELQFDWMTVDDAQLEMKIITNHSNAFVYTADNLSLWENCIHDDDLLFRCVELLLIHRNNTKFEAKEK